MLARYRRPTDRPIHIALSGGERQAAGVRRLSVNLQGATLGIPANWQPDVLLGHDRLVGDDLSPQGPHAECGIMVAGEPQSACPWGHRLRVFVQWSKTLTSVSEAITSVGESGTSQDGPYFKEQIIIGGSHMAAARGLTAAALLEKQIAQELKVKKEREQEASREAANDPAA